MAHNLSKTNGKYSFCFSNSEGKAWHGLGQGTDSQEIDTWIREAGLDYTVEQAPVTYMVGGELFNFDDRFVNYRSDNGKAFEVVSDRYKLVQPREAVEFFRGLVHDEGLNISAAGSLGIGQKYWATARLPGSYNDGVSSVDPYVLFVTSADGTLGTIVRQVSERVVCQNTLAVALGEQNKKEVKTKHSTNFDPRKVKAQMNLDKFSRDWEEFTHRLKLLQDYTMTETEVRETFAALLRPPKEDRKAETFADLLTGSVAVGENVSETKERAIRGLDDLMECYQTAPGAIPGTAYGALQGMTYYVDHFRGNRPDSRTDSAWLGQGATLKDNTFQALLNKV